LLKKVDLTTLLGETPIANPNPGGCIWNRSGWRWPGAAGTAKDLQALRPVAKKAIAAF
jgi:hypothetical protein